ncbi:CU044_2847 family protein [Actinomycetes bacterium KLBMP 9797]
MTDADILVKVVDPGSGREIGWDQLTERLRGRLDDVRRAVSDGVGAVAAGIGDLATPDGWEASEVSATFGVALLAETGALLTKASGEATFEVTVTYRRAG